MSISAVIGFSTLDFAPGLDSLDGALDRFAELGAGSVELSLPNFEVIGGCRIYRDRLAELTRICARHDLAYTVHGPIKSTFADAAHLDLQKRACRACLEVAGEIGATAQVHHAAILPADAPDRADRLAMERDALAEMAEPAAAAGVVLAVETLYCRAGEWTASPGELAAQIRAVDHPNIRACIDFSHAFINATARGFDILAELEALAPVACHLHLHDSFAAPQSFRQYSMDEAILFGQGDIHLPPGRGDLPWEALARLPYPEGALANLELMRRHADQLGDALAWARSWVGRN